MSTSNAVPISENAVEWLNWSKAIGLVIKAQVGGRASHALADWSAQGFIETKASLVIGDGEVRRDVALDADLWAFCRQHPLILNGLNGAMSWSYEGDEDGSRRQIIGPMFRKDQLLGLLSHVPPSEVEAVLAPGGGWMEDEPAAIEAKAVEVVEMLPPAVKRGRKTDKVRWTAFWFCVVELGREGRLQRGCFNSAQELGDELLLQMGDDAFSYDHVKAEVGQIYKRFVGD